MAAQQSTFFDVEIWKPVAGYERAYEVSTQGRVRGLDRKVIGTNGVEQPVKGRLLSLNKDRYGYLYVNLYGPNGANTFKVHRLVASAFIGECPNGYHVDHIDNVRTNNAVENLQFISPAGNIHRQSLFGTSQRDRVEDGTHPQTKKTHCPRGHLLEAPNLEKSTLKRGGRKCIACSRASSWLRYRGINLLDNPDLAQKVSDSHYSRIMSLITPPPSV